MPNPNRKQLFVDAKVQGTILLRIATYWFCCILFITLPSLIARIYFQPHLPLAEHFSAVLFGFGPVLTAVILLFPLAVYDCLKLTNRFAGPLFRLHREMDRLAGGEKVGALKFRDNDFWQELTIPFNKISEQLQAARLVSIDGESADDKVDVACEQEPAVAGADYSSST